MKNNPTLLTTLKLPNFSRYIHSEPVKFGIPIKKGLVKNANFLKILDHSQNTLQCNIQVSSRWSDDTLQWVSIQTTVHFFSSADVEIALYFEDNSSLREKDAVSISPLKDRLGIGNLNWRLRPSLHQSVELKSAQQTNEFSEISSIEITKGNLNQIGLSNIEWTLTTECFPQIQLKKIQINLANTSAMAIKNGLWDLGDPNSFEFLEFCGLYQLESASCIESKIELLKENLSLELLPQCEELFQASSGGENWNSLNHQNKSGEVTTPFRGFRWKGATSQGEGERANPIITLVTSEAKVQIALPQFWQKFPSKVKTSAKGIEISLFPELKFPHELQPGEQCTHTIYIQEISYENPTDKTTPDFDLKWVFAPTFIQLDPRYIAETESLFCFYTTDSRTQKYHLAMQEGVEGPNSFFSKREIIDEYGWRNFGDVYADHETQYYKENLPLISHYNNQYDLLYGFLIQFLRTQNHKWYQLSFDLVEHILDIDIYHTTQDKVAFNGGYFWHTDHYVHAHTSTHRTYSKKHPLANTGKYGGGPSNEHNYTSGILLWYLLTGDSRAKKEVQHLAEWVIRQDNGENTIFQYLVKGYTGRASATYSEDFHGPGRGCGNSINALLDAYTLTKDIKYLNYAELLIRRTVHPQMDLNSLDLKNLEGRWSYLVYLQALGKYLYIKRKFHYEDNMYSYGVLTLNHFALWMAQHELPFQDQMEKVEYPTETWVAHDMRKCHIFYLASFFCGIQNRTLFQERAQFFYDRCLLDLEKYPTRTQTRPMAILLSCGYVYDYFLNCSTQPIYHQLPNEKFPPQSVFVSQKTLFKQTVKTPRGFIKALFLCFHPIFMKRLFYRQW